MWIVLALTAALGTALREVLVKSVMRAGDEVAVAFVVMAVAAVLLLPFALATGVVPEWRGFGWALLVSGAANAVAAVLIARAVHVGDLSLGAPLQSATPVFLIPTGWLILGELPGRAATAGVLLIAAGAWVLGTSRAGLGVLAPLRALARDHGARSFFLVAAIFSISAAVDKVGVQASAPVLWAGAVNVFVASVLFGVLLLRGQLGRVRALLARGALPAGAAGTVLAGAAAAQMAALPLTLAAHVIAVKRSSVLLSVLAGGLLFRERGLPRRLVGALLMLAGFALVTTT